MSEPISSVFTAQFYGCKVNRDGGGRLTLDFGKHDLTEVQKLQEWCASLGDVNLQVAVVPSPEGREPSVNEHGEIVF